MASPPKVIALLLCNEAIVAPRTNSMTLFGIHDHVGASSFPFTHRPFAIYFKVTSMNGEYELGVQIVSPDGLTTLANAVISPPLTCNDPLRSIEVSLNFPRIQFDVPGRYAVRLIYNGRIAETVTLRVAPE